MRLSLSATLPKGPFWQALACAGLLMLGALVAMALTLLFSLQHADRLLDRLSRSQDQLAMVTRIEADINRLRGDVAAGMVDPEPGEAAIARQVEAYRQSVDAEGRQVSRAASPDQQAEVRNAALLETLFGDLRQRMPLAAPSASPAERLRFDDVRRRFETVAAQIIANERLETRSAIGSMRSLRRTMTLLGVAIPILVAMVAAIGAWIMLASMVRPLRVLEEAARRAGRGESVAPVRVDGFAELQQLAEAFNHMDDQISAHRAALSEANRDLEGQVSDRTREIEAGRQKLAEVDRTRRLFYSRIGHELRTPITVMRGEAEIALRDADASADRLREALEHVAANGSFLQRRLEDMLALARAEDGRIALQKEAIDLADMVRRTALLAEPYVRSSGSELRTDVLDQTGPVIMGDASWLQQGLLALVDNAAKFSGGQGVIRVSFSVEGALARIAVIDGGPGVDAADLPFLFESYYQTVAGRARGGSGLGLSVARWVVEQHGGTIMAESAEKKGLTVWIELPVAS